MSQSTRPGGMSARQAHGLEFAIIALCVVALIFIFQPFSLTLFGIGAGLVVLGGLAFNLMPFCRPGVPVSTVLRAGLIVLAILLIAILLAIGSAHLYALYLASK